MIGLKFYCNRIIAKLIRFGVLSHGGRNFLGKVCIKGRGGGNKNNYRLIDFYRRVNVFGKVLKLLYDCNRTAHIALVLYKNGLNSFIIATENIKLNDPIFSGNIGFEASQKYIG
jgi:large subunit ribosomal protein L2